MRQNQEWSAPAQRLRTASAPRQRRQESVPDGAIASPDAGRWRRLDHRQRSRPPCACGHRPACFGQRQAHVATADPNDQMTEHGNWPPTSPATVPASSRSPARSAAHARSDRSRRTTRRHRRQRAPLSHAAASAWIADTSESASYRRKAHHTYRPATGSNRGRVPARQ